MSTETKSVLLETRDLTIRFGDLAANDGVSLCVESGQIHAILGENGAGKSTLMKMLYGVYTPTSGTIRMEGEPVVLHPPAQARSHGIRMVFQDFRLVPALTVLENIALAVAEGGMLLKERELRRRIAEVSRKYRLEVDPDACVWQLDLGQRQRVEILKVLTQENTRLVIFDEPTSVLTPSEVDAFLQMLRELRGDGYGVLLITHKINEVLAVADRATVLRHGRVTFTTDRGAGLDAGELISQMMGEKYAPAAYARSGPACEKTAALEINGLTLADDRERTVLSEVDLCLHEGEILGVAGISGNGQKELVEALFGLRRCGGGRLRIGDRDMTGQPVQSFLDAGMAYICEDPLKESVIPGFSILEHMVLAGLPMVSKGWGVDWPKVRSDLDGFDEVTTLGLAAPERRADKLSGGNVQRMLLVRALVRSPRVLLCSYPTRGLDIGTTRAVHKLLLGLREQGSAILLISEDLSEIFEVADRIVVLGGRKIYGPYDPKSSDPYSIGQVMLKGEGE